MYIFQLQNSENFRPDAFSPSDQKKSIDLFGAIVSNHQALNELDSKWLWSTFFLLSPDFFVSFVQTGIFEEKSKLYC